MCSGVCWDVPVCAVLFCHTLWLRTLESILELCVLFCHTFWLRTLESILELWREFLATCSSNCGENFWQRVRAIVARMFGNVFAYWESILELWREFCHTLWLRTLESILELWREFLATCSRNCGENVWQRVRAIVARMFGNVFAYWESILELWREFCHTFYFGCGH